MTGGNRQNRVVESHTIARLALRLGGAFAVIAVVWAGLVLIRGGSWWGPLHAFVAGTVLLAISGAAQMFTITWASAPPPPRSLATFQRRAVAGGVALVLIGVTAQFAVVTWVGALSVASGLVALTVSITGVIRKSLLRRFDLSARFYVTAFMCGIAGVLLGGVLGTAAAGARAVEFRLVHSHLNLLGLVGLTIVGTLPTFLPTIAHHRAVSGREAVVAWWLGVSGVVFIASGLLLPSATVGVGNFLIAASGLLILTGVLVRLWEKGSSRLAFLQVSLGVLWLATWAVVDGIGILSSGASPVFGGWAAAAVVAGVAQVLAGSLAYIVPVLIGSPTDPFGDILTRRRWVPLLAANVGGVALAAGWETAATIAVGIWVADIVFRVFEVARKPVL